MSLVIKRFYNLFEKLRNIICDVVIISYRDRKVSLDVKEIDYDIFEIRDIKISVIKPYLDFIKSDDSFRYHLLNKIFIGKGFFHRKSCLIHFLSGRNIKFKKIKGFFLSKYDKTIFKKNNVNCKKVGKSSFSVKTFSMFFYIAKRFFFQKKMRKYFPNKEFFDTNLNYTKFLRAWLDMAENIYVNKLKKSLDNTIIHVNPGYIGDLLSKRQERYIEHLHKDHLNFFYYVPVIKILNMIKIVFSLILISYPIDIKVAIIDVLRQRDSVDDYVDYIMKKFPNIHTFYTKEEFIPSTTYLTEKLKKNKIKVVNFAHGVGTYCPYVNYDEFYLYSKYQKNWYFGPANFKSYAFEASPIIDRPEKPFALLFIGQNIISKVPSPNLNSNYRKILRYIDKINEELQFPIFVKYHPNSKDEDKILSKNIISIKKLEDLPKKYNYLAVTYYSTYVIDLLSDMPFIYINPDKKTPLQYFFPSDDIFFAQSYEELKNKIHNFVSNPGYYYEYWNEIIKEIE